MNHFLKMKEYKINNDKKSIPPKEVIQQKKDFGKLFHEYEKITKRPKKPIYKNKKYFFFLLLIALLTYLIVEFTNK